jgi:hypothetical protein
MRILFQGGWKAERDDVIAEARISEYCRAFAQYLVKSHHSVMLTTIWTYENMIADEVVAQTVDPAHAKKHVEYFISDNEPSLPKVGTVIQFEAHKWWGTERTLFVNRSDAVVVIGGGEGAVDCIEKAILAKKPVFVVGSIPGVTAKFWKKRPATYKYVNEGDTIFTEDLNISADDYFHEMFRLLADIEQAVYSREIFVVHGHDYSARDSLVRILNVLDFMPVVLVQEAGRSQTIIEHIEKRVQNVGYAFILYTADDLGHQEHEPERPRARQNVIFEHGILLGLLGRERTCALVKGDVEIPSDLSGVIHEKFRNLDEEALKIVKTLKDAGYQVDASRLV